MAQASCRGNVAALRCSRQVLQLELQRRGPRGDRCAFAIRAPTRRASPHRASASPRCMAAHRPRPAAARGITAEIFSSILRCGPVCTLAALGLLGGSSLVRHQPPQLRPHDHVIAAQGHRHGVGPGAQVPHVLHRVEETHHELPGVAPRRVLGVRHLVVVLVVEARVRVHADPDVASAPPTPPSSSQHETVGSLDGSPACHCAREAETAAASGARPYPLRSSTSLSYESHKMCGQRPGRRRRRTCRVASGQARRRRHAPSAHSGARRVATAAASSSPTGTSAKARRRRLRTYCCD